MERDGRADVGQVWLELVESGRNWVHVSVVDDATGRPVPCRVHFRSAGGIPYQPHGHHNHVTQNLGNWHCEVPSQTFTNRSFYHAATSSGFVVNVPYENFPLNNDAETIFERLDAAG